MQESKAQLPPRPGKSLAWLREVFTRLAGFWSTPQIGRVALCSPLVGVISGLGAVGFLLSLQFMYRVVLGGLIHLQMPPTGEDQLHAITYPSPWWLVVLVPAVGGLISGILVFTWASEAEGHGTDAMIRAFHRGLDEGLPAVGTVQIGGIERRISSSSARVPCCSHHLWT